MRGMLVVAAVALQIALAAAPAAQTQPAIESVKTELQSFFKELGAALAARDRAALERLYAPEFVFVHTIGPPVGRAEHLASTMATAPRTSPPPVPSLDGLIVIGNVAILRSREAERFSTSIWTKRDGQWQVLQIQATPLPPPPRAVLSLPAELLRNYAGRYRQDNGLLVTVAVEGEHLTLQVDGRAKFVLSARSDTEFSLPGDAARITFAPGGTYEFRRPNQPVITGIKQ
jgi:hypothetical protein